MQLDVLALARFRNLGEVRIEPHARFNIIEGRNGHGKTNLLEAVYLLSTFRSFRDARNTQLVQHGADEARVYGEIVRREVRRSVEIAIGRSGKQVSLDGKRITRLPDELAHLNVVLFGPDDLTLTKGGPAERRKFVDRAIYAIWPDYVNDLRGYKTAISNRNQLLKQARGRLDRSVLEAFEGELVRHGARVLQRRLAFVRSFAPHFERIFHAITGEELSADLRYRGHRQLDVAATELPPLEQGLAAALDEARDTDLSRGFTTVGPHTDDLNFRIEGRSARVYASQGQHRAFVLALKIAELERIRETIGVYPVFLLDDVSSELDERRNATLMEYLDAAGGQVFVTTTDRRWIKVSGGTAVYRVAEGAVTLVDPG